MYKRLKESYKDFDWKRYNDYCLSLASKKFSGDLEDTYNTVCDHFEKLNIELFQASSSTKGDWLNSYIFNGETHSGGQITLFVDFDAIHEALANGSYADKRECITSLSQVAIHELMHRHQFSKHKDRNVTRVKTRADYMKNKDEISAKVLDGIVYLIDIGYTKAELEKALRTIDADLANQDSPFWESNTIWDYWDEFGAYDSKDPTWLRVKKELYARISELDDCEV